MLKGNISNLRGKITQDAPIGQESWFRAGGAADTLFQPADQEDLQEFLAVYPLTSPSPSSAGWPIPSSAMAACAA